MQLQDPSLENNYIQLFQVEKPITITSINKQLEDFVMFRLFKNSMGYKIQLTSQSNISFFYYTEIAQFNFQKLSKDNQLNIHFDDFGKWFISLVGHKNHHSEKYSTQSDLLFKLIIKSKIEAKLSIIKEQSFKVYQFAKFDIQIGTEKMLRQSLMYRYQRMKLRKLMLNEYLDKIQNIVKTKNPSLLLDLNRIQNKKTPFK